MHRKDTRLTEAQRTGKSGRQRSLRKPPEGMPFTWLSHEILESVAWRSLSGNALQVLSRLCVEDQNHAGTENGSLICTHSDFKAYGIRGASIAQAIRETEYFGFIRVQKGRAYKGHREPSVYRLTWLPSKIGEPATNEWKSITQAHVKAFKAERAEKGRLKQINKKKRNHFVGDEKIVAFKRGGVSS